MCLIFISVNDHPDYKLIVAANRDEFYDRKTAPVHQWKDHPEIIGGRDLEAGGTWLGVTKSGRISMVTNYRDLKNIRLDAPSRGELVTNFLLTEKHGQDYLRDLQPSAPLYNGFNLIVGIVDDLWYCSNFQDGIEKLPPGQHGLSNHLLNTPWPKVARGKERFRNVLRTPFTAGDLFSLLLDDQIAADDQLPETGVGLERERALSSMFIKSPGYGTRSSTVILIDNKNNLVLTERVYDLTNFEFKENAFTFKIESL